MSKKTRIKLTGEGWDKYKCNFPHIYKNSIIEVEFNEEPDVFTDDHGYNWVATPAFYAIEILPDKLVPTQAPNNETQPMQTWSHCQLINEIEKLKEKLNEARDEIEQLKEDLNGWEDYVFNKANYE